MAQASLQAHVDNVARKLGFSVKVIRAAEHGNGSELVVSKGGWFADEFVVCSYNDGNVEMR